MSRKRVGIKRCEEERTVRCEEAGRGSKGRSGRKGFLKMIGFYYLLVIWKLSRNRSSSELRGKKYLSNLGLYSYYS